jgi:hypothetical protein
MNLQFLFVHMFVYIKHLLFHIHGISIEVRNLFFPLRPFKYTSSQRGSLVYRRNRAPLNKNNAAGVSWLD